MSGAFARGTPTVRIGNRALAFLLAACSAWCAAPRIAAAQSPPAAPQASAEPEKAAGRSAQAVEAVEPEIMYVPDKKGGRDQIPLLNLTLEEIHELMELRDGSGTARRPGFRLKDLTVSGKADAEHAALSIELTIDGSDPEWVRVPLRLGSVVLVERAEFEGEGEHLFEFDAPSREYVAWLRGATTKPRKLRLTAWAPLEHEAGETRLRLNMPRATYSNLRLSVPLAHAAGRVVSGGILADSKQADGKTEFHVTGLTGDFIVAWEPTAERRAEAATILSVDGQVVASIDSRGIRTAATLRLNAFGRDFTSFRVRLPRGATLVPAEQPNYTVTEINADQATPPASGPPANVDANGRKQEADRPPRVVEVRLKAKSAGQEQRIQLVTEQAHDVAHGDGAVELGGFEVIDAVRQFGYLAVQVKDDWQVNFGDLQGVQQSDDLPSEMPRENVIAGFVYYGQPYSLPAHVAPRQTRTSVNAHYVVSVAPRQMRLDATLKYHVMGAKVFSLDIDLGDWRPNLASLGRNTLIDGPRVDFGPGNLLRIPLKQAITGELELKLEAQQEIAAESVEFGLPRPAADTVGPAELVVMSDDNVLLAPRELRGLTSEAAAGEPVLPGRQPIWRYRAETADARFAGSVRMAVRRVTARVKSKVTIAPDGAQVDQWFDYDIENEAAESLSLDVPRTLAAADLIEARFRGTRLKFEAASATDVQDGPVVHRRLPLPSPCLGPCQLRISYHWRDTAMASPPPLTTVPIEVPLVMPGEAECVSNDLTVVSGPAVRVVPVGKEWSSETSATSQAASEGLMLTAAGAKSFVALGVENQQNEALVVDRAWLTTTLSAHARQDRVVLRFTAPAAQVTLRLPPGAWHERVWLDSRELVGGVEERPGERTIALTAGADWHVLESTYDVALAAPPHGRQTLATAELAGAASTRRAYWQLVLPSGEFLLAGPETWTPEFSWRRHGLAWVREPLVDSAELDGWIEARATDQPLSSSGNRYLFSSLEPTGAVEVQIVGRSPLVLAASGVVLALGLLWLYVPKLRHPLWLFLAGVALLTAAALWPDVAPLAAQASLVGGILAGFAVLLDRTIARWQRAPAAFRPASGSLTSSSIVSRGSAHPPLAVPASTRSVVPLELTAPEPRS
jgi:hypothetical protein